MFKNHLIETNNLKNYEHTRINQKNARIYKTYDCKAGVEHR